MVEMLRELLEERYRAGQAYGCRVGFGEIGE
jgi:hypothetical protein